MVETPNTPILPPLENGDRLNRYEFERRYSQTPLKKAELIEGVVYITTTVRFRSHAVPHANLSGWLSHYKIATPHLELGNNPTVRLDGDNTPQPDIVLLIAENANGQARISEDDYIEGAPELVAEIAASSVSIDLHAKKQAYRRNGVKEYIVWQVYDQKIDWFYLQEGEYIALPPDDNNIIRSRTFGGLWLAPGDLLAGNMTQVLAVLQQGLNSRS